MIARFTIAATHPALAGHFPGRPIVLGVVLIEAVTEAARAAYELGPAMALPRAKFLAPVLPDQEVAVELTRPTPSRIAFICRVADRIVATGDVEFAA